MISYRQQREARRRLKFSAMGKKSQRVQRERRLAEVDRLAIESLPLRGDAIGCLQWHDFRSGQVRRWTVRIGDRADRVTLDVPYHGRTASHGWTWILNQLRGHLAGTKA